MPSHSTKQAKVMSAIAHGWKPKGSVAKIPLRVAKEFHAADAGHKYGKGMSRGGNPDDGSFDPSRGGAMPRAKQNYMESMPDSFGQKGAPYPIYQPPSSKDIDDVSYDDGGGVDDLPDVGPPAIDPGPQISAGTRWGNRAADIGSQLAYRYSRSPYDIAANLVTSTVDAAKQPLGSDEYHEAIGDVGRATGDAGLSMLGRRGPGGGGARLNAASLLPVDIWKEDPKKLSPGQLVKAGGDGPVGQFKGMSPGGTYPIVDWKHKAAEPAPSPYKAPPLSDNPGFMPGWSQDNPELALASIKSKLEPSAQSFKEYFNAMKKAPSLAEMSKMAYYDNLRGVDPIDQIRQARGYTEPAYRGVTQEAKPVHGEAHPEFPEQYSAANPDLADMYASRLTTHPRQTNEFTENANVMPLWIDTRNYHHIDAAGGSWEEVNPRAIREATKLGKHGVVIDNVWDEPGSTKALGSPQRVFITLPEGLHTVKSKFAKEFNPTSTNMLRGVGAIGAGGAGAMGYMEKDQPEGKAGGGRVRKYAYGGGIPRFASGGMLGGFNPERAEAYGLARQGQSGMLHSNIPGRTDKLNLNVATGSYIIPADITSALGEGNSMAGESVLNKMFTKGPYGMNLSKMKGPRTHNRAASLSKIRFAQGGGAGVHTTPIVAAGGEYVVHPEDVAKLGNGNVRLGHDILDAFVKHVRQKHISTLKGLKPPKGSK